MDFSTSPSTDSSCIYKLFIENLLGDMSTTSLYCPSSIPSAIAVSAYGRPKENGKMRFLLNRIENNVTARLKLKIEGTINAKEETLTHLVTIIIFSEPSFPKLAFTVHNSSNSILKKYII